MIEIPIIADAFKVYAKQYRSLGDYSVTTIIDSPRRGALVKRYGADIEQTPESMASSLAGTAIHEKMETLLRMASALNSDYMLERSVVMPYEMSDGVTKLVAGRFDILWQMKHLFDIKSCKVWKLIFDPDKEEWTKQQNLYAFLLREKGFEIESINVVAFYLDWIESQSLRDKRYPQSPIVQYPLELWSAQDQYEFLMERLNMHYDCEFMKDDDLPECTHDEMWENDAEYAIYAKPGLKRATKVVRDGNLDGAIEIARTQVKNISRDSFIEIRRQKRKRCEGYCHIKEHCNQYKAYAAEVESGARETNFSLASVI